MELSFGIVAMTAIIGLVSLGLALALIPVRLQVTLSSQARRLTVRYWNLTIADTKRPHQEPETGKRRALDESTQSESTHKGARPASWRRSQMRHYANIAPRLVKALLGFSVRVGRKMRLRNIRGSVSGGFADPADTGMAFGALSAIVGAMPVLQSQVRVKPDYLAERIMYDLRGEIALRPVALLGPAVRLMRDLPKRELLRIIWRQMKLRRRQEVKGSPE